MASVGITRVGKNVIFQDALIGLMIHLIPEQFVQVVLPLRRKMQIGDKLCQALQTVGPAFLVSVRQPSRISSLHSSI